MSDSSTPAAPSTPAPAPKLAKKKRQQDGLREITESFVVAFVLAFLFRAFEAEAFVIPTGSMAPTLFGRHKEATCKACGYHFAFGASDEMDDDSGIFNPGRRISAALCPNCRFDNPVLDEPAFKGDRIIVNKFPYEFRDPERWDVPVFKYPEKPTTNYIKRLVGLPNETLIIKRGDVYRQEEDRSVSILRKEPRKQKVLQIPVYDQNHPETPLHQVGWPRRWAPMERSEADVAKPAGKLVIGPIAGWVDSATGWEEDDATHSFALSTEKNNGPELKWIRYRHIIPSPQDWGLAHPEKLGGNHPDLFAQDTAPAGPRPQLITDFCGYNSYTGGNGDVNDDCFWIGDLTLTTTVTVQSLGEKPELVLELNEGVRCYRVRIDVATGQAKLISVVRLNPGSEEEDVMAEAKCAVRGVGQHDIRFANVDDRLCVWVDESLIDFGSKAEYRVDEATQPGPRDEDLMPVAIAGRGMSARVSNLLIQRDIYYRASQSDNSDADRFHFSGDEEHPDRYSLRRSLKNPSEWAATYLRGAREAKFALGPDEYMMLGDNSPRSQDSRVWPNTRGATRRHAVPRSALVGRAFFVYWPHGVPFLNNGQGYPVTYLKSPDGKEKYADMRVPFYPNIARMRRIH